MTLYVSFRVYGLGLLVDEVVLVLDDLGVQLACVG